MQRIWMVAAGLALSACAQVQQARTALPLTRADVTPAAAASASGEALLAVRATLDGVSAPASCTASGAGFDAAFTAPADVAVPTFGTSSVAVRIVCRADGLSGARIAQPSARRAPGAAGLYPAIGVGIGSGGDVGVSFGGWWGGGSIGNAGAAGYAIRYPAVEVALE